MISVVIPNFNGKHFLDSCLSSLANQTNRDFEIIVVDNASSDGSLDFLKTKVQWVKVVSNKHNLGFAGGVNSGIEIAEGDYILTLNNDTIADERFLEYLIKPMSDSRVGMCAPKMLFPDGRINSAGICLSRSGAAWGRGIFELAKDNYEVEEEVFGPCGGAALYRKKMIGEIGAFDEDFFLYMEDVDLAFRGRLAGWKCVYVPQAKVVHFHGGTVGFESDLSIYYGNRNMLWYVIKDFPWMLIVTCLPWIVGRNLGSIPYYIFARKTNIILRSEVDAIKGIPSMFRKRRFNIRRASNQNLKRFISTWAWIEKR
ncbi:MAG: glycosyltransferase family 2 protein [Methanotrichaceae archaeon]|nr:glycosyltransferase family 2 protein [Methanotrichaceae archaeon]